jgi:catechol 2,3-dioxygenase-like lactoylglutathione lyase family enzyme
MQIALSDTSPQIELIEPLEGPSIYDGWLGIHHVGLYVPSLAESIASMQAQGFEPIQTGTGYGATGDGGFAYFDTTRQLAMIIEAIERPAVRREPDFVLRGGSAAGLL